jgi:hypothetical protein
VAQKIQVILEDDIHGGPAEGTVKFSLDGANYEIDLNEENASSLREIFQPYVENARKAGGAARRRTRVTGQRGRTADIRTWAKQAGIHVNDRGRIPVYVVTRYEAAHADV